MDLAVMVDMQNDFVDAVDKGEQAVNNAHSMLEGEPFDLVIATQDYHPEDHISFADNHEDYEVLDVIDTGFSEQKQTLWPTHCVKGERGAELHQQIKNFPNIIIRKGTMNWKDSYSLFCGWETGVSVNGIFSNLLNVYHVDVYLFGIATDICVLETGKDINTCIERRIQVDKKDTSAELYFIENCSAGLDPEETIKAKQILNDIGYERIEYKDYLETVRNR